MHRLELLIRAHVRRNICALISSDPAAAYNQPIDTHRGVRMELDAGGCDVSHGGLTNGSSFLPRTRSLKVKS